MPTNKQLLGKDSRLLVLATLSYCGPGSPLGRLLVAQVGETEFYPSQQWSSGPGMVFFLTQRSALAPAAGGGLA